MSACVALQLGPFANYIGAHFWNLQKNHSKLLYEAYEGHYAPRVVIVDTIGHVTPRETWPSLSFNIKTDLEHPHPFHLNPNGEHDFETTVRAFTDYLHNKHWQNRLSIIPSHMTGGGLSFDSYMDGLNLPSEHPMWWETLTDQLRKQFEAADILSNIQLLSDWAIPGYTGLTTTVLTYLADILTKVPIAFYGFSTAEENDENSDPIKKDSIMSAYLMNALIQDAGDQRNGALLSKVVVSNPTPGQMWKNSFLPALAIDSIPSRESNIFENIHKYDQSKMPFITGAIAFNIKEYFANKHPFIQPNSLSLETFSRKKTKWNDISSRAMLSVIRGLNNKNILTNIYASHRLPCTNGSQLLQFEEEALQLTDKTFPRKDIKNILTTISSANDSLPENLRNTLFDHLNFESMHKLESYGFERCNIVNVINNLRDNFFGTVPLSSDETT